MKKLLAVLAFLISGLAALSASAEKADASKQAVILYDSADFDELAQTTVLTGDVSLTKGTLLLKSDSAILKRSPDDYTSVTLTAAPGKTATFRQKRDGGPDLWVEGQAQRIEYDERHEVIKLFGDAKIRQLEGQKPTDEMESAFISYDSRKEFFKSRNTATGESKPGKGRGMMIVAPPKPRPATPAPAGSE